MARQVHGRMEAEGMSNAFIEADVYAEDFGPYMRLAILCGDIFEDAFLDRDQCRKLATFIGDFLEADQAKRALMHLTSPYLGTVHVGASRRFCLSLTIDNVEAHMESWEARELMEDLLDWEGEP